MTTPTLCNQIAGAMKREEGVRRVRSEAAKKAWRTRRRRAKLSPTMSRILTYLTSKTGARISVHYSGRSVYYVSLTHVNDDGSQGPTGLYGREHRITRASHRAIEKRGWLEFVRRRESGHSCQWGPDGWGEKIPSYDLDYRISDKGRATLAKALASRGVSRGRPGTGRGRASMRKTVDTEEVILDRLFKAEARVAALEALVADREACILRLQGDVRQAHAARGQAELHGHNLTLVARVAVLEAACRAAVLCRDSIERNKDAIYGALAKDDARRAGVFLTTVAGWVRNLSHADAALAPPEVGTPPGASAGEPGAAAGGP